MKYYSDLRNLLDRAEEKSNKCMEAHKSKGEDPDNVRQFNKILFALNKAYDILEEAMQD